MAVMEDILLLFPSITSLLGTVLILLVIHLTFTSFASEKNCPPGPTPLPLVGNLLQLGRKLPHIALYELYKKHGPIFTVHLGPKKAVVLAGYKTIKQALVNVDAFSEKETLPIIKDLKLTHGIIFANGDSWKEMRHFTLTALKDFGMGKTAAEEKIIEETERLIEVFQEKEGKAFDTAEVVNHAVCNIICSIVYGKRFEYDDPEFTAMVGRATRNTQLLGCASVELYNYFPRLFYWVKTRKELMESAFANRRQLAAVVKGLQDTLDPQMCRGLVDSFLTRKIQLEASGNMNSHYHEDNLLITVVNLFTAGTETTSTTLRCGLLLMAKYPEIQDKVQEELARVVGNRQVQAGDRRILPYTEAVIHEIQRLSNIVPIIVHCTSQDVIFQSYFIKKGTPVILLLSSALLDENEWEKSSSFNPAHFLDERGNFRRREAFLPFSTGPRACVGESLAKMELFLFFASLLQRCRFTPPPGMTEDDLDLTLDAGFILTPVPHKLCATSRV
ncbi:cytochrome P450 2K1-like [Archocentrus centrarchus]|uniref:cytochrome P450 2K1-like n=1 Tax=Archocentrus centrarchus TaxID=63155 RepID=UPI0011E9D57E|nr:cytochrome P450 2K1-like [Archocentrus centrarchus]